MRKTCEFGKTLKPAKRISAPVTHRRSEGAIQMSRKLLAISVIILGLSFSAAALAQTEPGAGGTPDSPGEPAAAAPAEPAAGGAATETPAATEAAEEPAAAEPVAVEDSSSGTVTSSQKVELKNLEQKVNELKEKIFRSKARLNLLKETVLHGVIAGSKAIIRHKNEMGTSFRLVKLVYSMDGAEIYAKADDGGALDKMKDFEVFNGSIVPGNHTVSVLMVFRGHGYGIFSYLKGYKFTVRSSHTFTAGEGRQTDLSVRAYEKGNITTELKDRPAIDFKVNLFSIGKGGSK